MRTFHFKEIQKISENVNSIAMKHKNLKEREEQSIIGNKAMTGILAKVTSSIAKLIQENKVIKEENSVLNERLIKIEYHSCCNNLLFDGFLESRN